MYIPDKSDYQPSAQTLNMWLATRKPTLAVGGVSMPGFFSDTGNSSDTGWFFVGLSGEMAGLVTTIYGGWKSGGIFLSLAILAIVMFIFCDFFFAKKLHRNKAKECTLRSKKLLKKDVKGTLELENELAKGKYVDFLLQAGIFCIALVKIVGILLLGVFNNIILYVPFAIIYLIVAYVHLSHTWYYVAYLGTQNAIEREHKMFGNGQFDAKEPDQTVETPKALRKMPIKHNPHEILADGNETNKYVIKTKGVLTDEDIKNLISGQEDPNKIELFRACRKLQLENLLAE